MKGSQLFVNFNYHFCVFLGMKLFCIELEATSKNFYAISEEIVSYPS